VYAGHAGVALVIKSRSPRTAITLLTIAAFGPDWTELLLGLVVGRANGEIYSHCLPGLVLGAALAWCVSALVFDREVAAPIALAWLLHWPADFVTALKPLIDLHHLVGLDLYQLPRVDLLIESLLVVTGCVLYARAYAPAMRQRLWVAAAGFALIGLQGVLDFGIAPRIPSGRPSWRPPSDRLMLSATGRTSGVRPTRGRPRSATRPPAWSLHARPALLQRASNGIGRSPRRSDADLPDLRQGKILHQRSARRGALRAVQRHRIPDICHPYRARRRGDRGGRGAGAKHRVR
jgi:hypothetical protein